MMSQLFRSFEANSGPNLTKMIGKVDQYGLSLATASILGQPPSSTTELEKQSPNLLCACFSSSVVILKLTFRLLLN